MFYLANDRRPDQTFRRCWTCGSDATPRAETTCVSCGATLRDRRFLVSARWDSDRFAAYQRFFHKQLRHQGLATPVDVFVLDGVLFSVIPYHGEGLMVDEAAPLVNRRLLELGSRIIGVLAFLRKNGTLVAEVTRANLLTSPDQTVRLFDLEVLDQAETPVPVDAYRRVLPSLGELLRRYCDIESDELAELMTQAERGGLNRLPDLGRRIEEQYPLWSAVRHPARLAGISDVGLTRQLNEDNWGWTRLSDRAWLYVVADGMGGHDGGEVASALAVLTLCTEARRRFQQAAAAAPITQQAAENLLRDSFQLANNTVKVHAEARGTDMGTTMVACLILDNRLALVANVGDSRGYLLREQRLRQLSVDHSLVQKMVDKGKITPAEARNHPHLNILLRTVGTDRDVEIDLFPVELDPGDRVVLCSDGLWGEVEDRDMESILNTYAEPRHAARELIRAAHVGGGRDNVTVLLVVV
jgi:protein phosphatase